MVWWKRVFKTKTETVDKDDWERVVYTRKGENIEEEKQQKR